MAEVRICEYCGHQNPMSAMACEQCGADLAFVQPTTVNDGTTQSAVKKWHLISEKTGQEFLIQGDTDIGRLDSDMAPILNESDYTSRHHARLSFINDALCVTDKSSNGTSLNGVRLQKGDAVELHDGDELSFADVVFTVKIC